MAESVKLGKVVGGSEALRIAPNALNNSILLIGQSGSGKTESIWKIAQNIVSEGGAAVILNYHGSFAKREGKEIKRICVRKEGFPFPLLISGRSGRDIQAEDDDAEAIADIFNSIIPLGARQKSLLRNVIRKVSGDKIFQSNVLPAIGETLARSGDDISAGIYEKFYALWKIKIAASQRIIVPGKITIIDFDGFNVRTQNMLAELALACVWRYFRICGQDASRPLYVVCDEFQALSLKKDSTLSQLLREGRKYKLALILATQTLETLEKSERALVFQTATRLFFRPAPNEIPAILKHMGMVDSDEMKKILLHLAVGECVASGLFVYGKAEIDYPIKMSFRNL